MNLHLPRGSAGSVVGRDRPQQRGGRGDGAEGIAQIVRHDSHHVFAHAAGCFGAASRQALRLEQTRLLPFELLAFVDALRRSDQADGSSSLVKEGAPGGANPAHDPVPRADRPILRVEPAGPRGIHRQADRLLRVGAVLGIKRRDKSGVGGRLVERQAEQLLAAIRAIELTRLWAEIPRAELQVASTTAKRRCCSLPSVGVLGFKNT